MLIAAVLAAGRSTRMGRDKLLLPLGDRPIIRHVIDAVSGVRPAKVLVVTSAEREDAIRGALAGSSVRILVNDRAGQGMGTSIACAACAVLEETEALLLAQGDQPLVSVAALERLLERRHDGIYAYVAARYGDLVTTPVVFSRALFAELRALDGDRGARRVLEKHRSEGAFLDLPPWMALDVDDAESYRRVQELWPPPESP